MQATATIEAITLPNGIEAYRVAKGLIFARLEAARRYAARLAAKLARAAEKARGTLAKAVAPAVEAVAEIRRNANASRKTWSVRLRRADGTATEWRRIADVPARVALATGRALVDFGWYPAVRATP